MHINAFNPIADIVKRVKKDAGQAHILRQQAYDNQQLTNATYQAYRQTSPPQTSGYAGLLNGISVSVKDLYGVAGMQSFAGTPFMFTDYEQNGPLVQALLDQGAYISGKTHSVEFAFGGLGTNPHWPVPRNPWDTQQHRVPGGSSSGAPVALLTHSCQLALGTDTAGSVRVPAAMCGTFGIKTSSGRWNKELIVPLSPTADTAGLLARSAADALWGFATLDPVYQNHPLTLIESLQIKAQNTNLRGCKVGLISAYFKDCEDGIAEHTQQALMQLQDAGAELIELDWPYLEETYAFFTQGGMSSAEFPLFILAPENQPWFDALADSTKLRFDQLKDTPLSELKARIPALQKNIATFQQAAHTCLAAVDFAVCPTIPISAPLLSEVEHDMTRYRERNNRALSHTQLVNYQDLCASTLPIGLNGLGMPCGLQIIMPHNKDIELMTWSLRLEQILGCMPQPSLINKQALGK